MKFKMHKIKELMIEKDISKSELSRMIGISRQNIGKWFASGEIPSKHQLKLFTSLGVKPFDESIVDLSNLTKQEEEVVNSFTKLYDLIPESARKVQENSTNYNSSPKGVPFHNIDFNAGFDVMENIQTMTPESFVISPLFNGSDYIVKCSGDSMGNKIPNGSYIGLKQISIEDILFGEIYAVVTKSWRTVKYVRKSKITGNILLVPDNREEYDEQDLKVSKILSIWLVIAFGLKIN